MKKHPAPVKKVPPAAPAASAAPPFKLFAAALILLGLFAWHNTLNNGFVYDDEGSVIQNPAIQTVSPLIKFFDPQTQSSKEEANRTSYRPLTTLAFAVLYQFNGLDPRVFHAANVAGHIANTLLVFYLLSLVFGSRWDAFMAAAIFLVHPIQTETVAWVTCLANINYLLFYLGSWILFVRWESDRSAWRYGLSLVLFVLALLSKEMAMSLPLVLAAYVFMRRRSQGELAGRFTPLLPYFITAIVYFGIRSSVLGQTAQTGYLAGGPLLQMLVMLKGFAEYVRMALWPHPQSIEYLFPASTFDLWTLLSAGLLVGLLALGVRLSRSRPMIGFGILLFSLALAPVSNLIPTLHFVNERHMYLSLVGWGLVLAALLEEGARRVTHPEWVRAGGLAALCVLYVPLTVARNAAWADSSSLAQADLKTSPDSPALHKLLARGYWDQKDWDQAIGEFQRALTLETAAKGAQAPDLYESYFGLGSAYIKKGDFRQAVVYLEKALEAHPNDIQTENNLAVAYAYAGDLSKAVGLLKTILEADPQNGFARRNLERFQAAKPDASR